LISCIHPRRRLLDRLGKLERNERGNGDVATGRADLMAGEAERFTIPGTTPTTV
jgi:hypothetical protein